MEEQLHGGVEEECGNGRGLVFIFGAAPWIEDLEDHYRGCYAVREWLRGSDIVGSLG